MTQKIPEDAAKPPPGEFTPSDELQIRRMPPTETHRSVIQEWVPSLESIPEHAAIVFNAQTMKEIEDKIKKSIEQLETHEFLSQNIEPGNAPSVNSWSKKHGKELLQVAKSKLQAAEAWGKLSSEVERPPKAILTVVEKSFTEPLESFMGYFTNQEHLGKEIVPKALEAKLVFTVPEILGNGASIIYKRTVLKQVKHQVDLMQKKCVQTGEEQLNKDIKELKTWLKFQDKLLTEEVHAFGVAALAYAPKAFKTAALELDRFTPYIQYGDLWVAAIISVVVNSYRVHMTLKNLKTQEEWLARFTEKPSVAEPIVEHPENKRLPKAPESMVRDVQKLLKKRENALTTNMDRNLTEIFSLIAQNEKFSIIKSALQKKGIDLSKVSKVIENKKDLLAAIEENKEPKRQLLKQYTEHKQTLSTMTRNALKALAAEKHRIERKFLKFSLNASVFALSISSITFSASLVLKTLAITGIFLTSAAILAWSGLGIFVLGAALIAAGLIMLHRVKPNLFKAFFQGVHLRLALNSIPAAYHNYQLRRKQVKILQQGLALQEFRVQTAELTGILEQSQAKEVKSLPQKLRPLLKKLQVKAHAQLESSQFQKIKKRLKQFSGKEIKRLAEEEQALIEKLELLEESVKKWKERMEPLKQRLIRAGWADFLRESRLAKDLFEEENIAEVLVEGIFVDTDLIDAPTRKILLNQLGINLDYIRNLEDTEKIKKEVEHALKTFFAMDESSLISFIKKQKEKFAFGILEGT